jgi:DNA-binding PadR family transcriptional regulator
MKQRGTPIHKLLVLGMLRMQAMHGYQVAEVIETHFGDNVHIKKPTMYDTLKKIAEEGLVGSREEQEGNRPPRTVYSITEQGELEFMRLLRLSVSEYDPPQGYSDMGLMFLDTLGPAEVRDLLTARRESIADSIAHHGEEDPHQGAMGLASERIHLHIMAELDWLDDVLGRPEYADTEDTHE